MADALRFHPLVADDLGAAIEWYENISVDLGNRFRRAVDARLDSIETHPESFSFVHEFLRAAIVDGFPYLITYRLHPQNSAAEISVCSTPPPTRTNGVDEQISELKFSDSHNVPETRTAFRHISQSTASDRLPQPASV